MSGLFGSKPAVQAPEPPPTPTPPPPPPAAPTYDEAVVKSRASTDALARRKGTSANIQSTGDGPTTAAAKLLGS